MQQYRLPDGTIIEGDTREQRSAYGKAWQVFAERVAKFFPGFRVMAMDPNVILVEETALYPSMVTLSLAGCKALLSLKHTPPSYPSRCATCGKPEYPHEYRHVFIEWKPGMPEPKMKKR